jgi:hypothetical protein
MTYHHIDKLVKTFLNKIFCVVGKNSPYNLRDFMQVLLDATEHTDFVNNSSVRVNGPTGETVFARLKDSDAEQMKAAFYCMLKAILPRLKRLLRNRGIALCFDTTDEPYYGKVEGFWIHPYQPVRGSTGCFKFITVSCTDRNLKLILGSLPVMIGADIVALSMELANKAREFMRFEIALFDRGFDDYRLLEALQQANFRYQILWRKNKWTATAFKTMKRGEIREVTRIGTYSKNKSKYKVKARFVLIKKYKRHKKAKAYDWVFVTNTRQKSQHAYVDKYRKRWNIETTFRVLDNIQIKTTTKNNLIRYFLNLFCCLIYNLWKLTNITEYKITLKNFVAGIVKNILSIQPTQET